MRICYRHGWRGPQTMQENPGERLGEGSIGRQVLATSQVGGLADRPLEASLRPDVEVVRAE